MTIGVRVSPSPRSAPVVHTLQAVEELEDRRDEEQRGAEHEHRFVGGEQADEHARHQQERRGGDRHECEAEQDRGPAGGSGAMRITARRPRVPHGRRPQTASPSGTMKASGRDVQRDLMRRGGDRRQLAGERRRRREHADFERDRRRRGKAETHQPLQPRPVSRCTRAAQQSARARDDVVAARSRRRETSPCRTREISVANAEPAEPERRRPEVAVDQRPVERRR